MRSVAMFVFLSTGVAFSEGPLQAQRFVNMTARDAKSAVVSDLLHQGYQVDYDSHMFVRASKKMGIPEMKNWTAREGIIATDACRTKSTFAFLPTGKESVTNLVAQCEVDCQTSQGLRVLHISSCRSIETISHALARPQREVGGK